MKKAIIIDDLDNARLSLKKDLEDYCPEIEVVGEAEGVVTGAKLIKETAPDIVFLDIQMKDGSGFDLLEILPEINFALIFTTSSDGHAIKAFRYAAVDYLLKPIDPQLLIEAVAKASKEKKAEWDTLRNNLYSDQKRLSLNSHDRVRIVDLKDVVRCESTGSYTLFYMRDGEQILVTKTLKEYESILADAGFLRVHQSHLVHLDYVKEFVKSDGGYVVMKTKEEIPVSSRKRSTVLKTLAQLG